MKNTVLIIFVVLSTLFTCPDTFSLTESFTIFPQFFRSSIFERYSNNHLNNEITTIEKRSESCASQWECRNGGCIPLELKCNGEKDCDDGSDETYATCESNACPPQSFRCTYGACVSANSRCNAVIDCKDESDEKNCPGQGSTAERPVTQDTDHTDSLISTHIFHKTVKKRPLVCRSDQWMCLSRECIDKDKVCDGNKDCPDGSDETENTCGRNRCLDYAFRCAYGACIDVDKKCNGEVNCADASDELNCKRETIRNNAQNASKVKLRSTFRCSSGDYISKIRTCNGRADCEDSSDETAALCSNVICPPKMFRCDYGACIEETKHCDGVFNCEDLSDERSCFDTSYTTTPNIFGYTGSLLSLITTTSESSWPAIDVRNNRRKRQSNCRRTQWKCRDGACIAIDEKCDGVKNCPDGSDETVATCANNKCNPFVFRCAYGGCVDADARCNNVTECADGSDERNCFVTETRMPNNCPKTSFQCSNGDCISLYDKCDGKADCKDKSDETSAMCYGNPCSPGTFKCNYGACIDDSDKCNRVYNCVDYSDETRELCGEEPPPTTAPPTATQRPTKAPTTKTTKPTTKPISPPGDGSGVCTIPPSPEEGYITVLSTVGEGVSMSSTPGTRVPVGIRLEFNCRKKYMLDGSEILKCQSNGQWDKKPPTCNKMCAPIFSTTIIQECETEGRKVTCDKDFKHGSTINLKCKRQHINREHLPKLMCLDGSWSHYIPKCEPECGLQPGEAAPLVLGGKQARRSELPWMVGIYSILVDFETFQHICGGTIISNTIVISAGHCFWNEEAGKLHEPENFQVATGKIYRDFDNAEDLKYTATVQRIGIKQIQTPTAYSGDAQNQQSDIAILKLEKVLDFSQFVLPACLDLDQAFDRNQLEAGSKGTVAGWGLIEEGGPASNVLKLIELPIVQYGQCRSLIPKTFVKYLTADKMCAGYLNGSGVCSGDSGGGLVFKSDDRGKERWYLRGIVSVGVPSEGIGQSCRKDTYSGFTRLFFHSDWILETVAQLNLIKYD